MSKIAVEGLRAERDAILTITKSLSDDEWNAPSDCDGWAVRDVVAHMGSILHGVADPSKMVDLSAGTEVSMEAPVAERRAWPVEEVLAEYETYSGQVADLVASLQDPPMSETMLPMGDLGTHPMSIMPSTFRPGSVSTTDGRFAGSRDEKRLRPTFEWMLAGLPWMCASQLAFVDRPINLVLTGVGGGTWSIGPGGEDGRLLVREGAAPDAAATVTSDGHDFVIWGTKRRPWRDRVQIDGDTAYAERVLDGIKII